MKEHEFWRERTGGHVYAVEFLDGVVSGICGPLEPGEVDDRFLATFDYSSERAAWAEQHRDEFDLDGRRPQSIVPVPLHHPSLDGWIVSDAMQPGVITCHSGSSLHEIARTLAAHGIHAVAVWGDDGEDSVGFLGIVSDLDLVSAVMRGESLASSAVTAARTAVHSVRADAPLSEAARLMVTHRTAHLIVLAGDRDRAVGVISTLDVARALTSDTPERVQ